MRFLLRLLTVCLSVVAIFSILYFEPLSKYPEIKRIKIKNELLQKQLLSTEYKPIYMDFEDNTVIEKIDDTVYINEAKSYINGKNMELSQNGQGTLSPKESFFRGLEILNNGKKRYPNSSSIISTLNSYRPTVTSGKASGTYKAGISVSLSTNPYANLYYSIGNNKNYKLYNKSLYFSYGKHTLYAKSSYGDLLSGNEYVFNYTVLPPDPKFKNKQRFYDYDEYIYLDNLKSDITYYYTLDGTTPDKNSDIYDGDIHIYDGETIISVIGITENGLKTNMISDKFYVLEMEDSEYPWWFKVRPENRYNVRMYLSDNPDAIIITKKNIKVIGEEKLQQKAKIMLDAGRVVFYSESGNSLQSFS